MMQKPLGCHVEEATEDSFVRHRNSIAIIAQSLYHIHVTETTSPHPSAGNITKLILQPRHGMPRLHGFIVVFALLIGHREDEHFSSISMLHNDAVATWSVLSGGIAGMSPTCCFDNMCYLGYLKSVTLFKHRDSCPELARAPYPKRSQKVLSTLFALRLPYSYFHEFVTQANKSRKGLSFEITASKH